MANDKALFSPVPLRAMAADMSGLQLRVLICVASHDRLSRVTGKGQGCRASNERMSQMIGCSYARLCSTLSELVALEYLKREKLGRHTVYRVEYTEFDRLLFSNVLGSSKGALSARRGRSIGCQPPSAGGGNPPETARQYIPLNGVIDTEESGEENSSEEARFAARRLGSRMSDNNVGAELAALERALKAGDAIDLIGALEWIGNDLFTADYPENIRGWALRLSDDVMNAMTPAEYDQWAALHGPGLAA